MSLGPKILGVTIGAYRLLLAPVLHFIGGSSAGCRFEPTCSQYAQEAVQAHGVLHGSWLAARRVCRCHPWGGCGADPVPAPKNSVPITP
jgi:putative membrane protein insertion efficiency factor